MSIGIAIAARDGVVLAADSRGTIGDARGPTVIIEDMQKVFQITSRCGMVVAGIAEMTDAILAEAQRVLAIVHGTAEPPTSDVVAALSQAALAFWGQRGYLQVPPEQRPSLQFLVGGVDDDGHPVIRTLHSAQNFAVLTVQNGFSVIGVPLFGYYWLSRTYSRDMSMQEARALAPFVIAEAATQDGKIGGSVAMASITQASGWNMIGPEELTYVAQSNKDLLVNLRESLVRRAVT